MIMLDNVTLNQINTLDETAATEAFRRCCGSQRWVDAMLSRRPFQNAEELFAAAETIWWDLSEEDWLEAFTHHPKIGDINSLREKFGNTKAWAEQEQGSVRQAGEAVLQALAEGNRAYEERFGFIFIVCATGKSAEEMLGLLQQRLPNSRESELRIAAAEQLKITRLRLEKL